MASILKEKRFRNSPASTHGLRPPCNQRPRGRKPGDVEVGLEGGTWMTPVRTAGEEYTDAVADDPQWRPEHTNVPKEELMPIYIE